MFSRVTFEFCKEELSASTLFQSCLPVGGAFCETGALFVQRVYGRACYFHPRSASSFYCNLRKRAKCFRQGKVRLVYSAAVGDKAMKARERPNN